MAHEDELNQLREENARLTAELEATKYRWERELIVAKAQLLTVQEELDATKERLRLALLRNIAAEDEVFSVREDAAKVVEALRQEV
ncbi:MAG: hypothetical protein IJV69_07690 [Kiritimatiellae bacterium]|nr:hypothetical protein [Kiritimatiellia bacterium]